MRKEGASGPVVAEMTAPAKLTLSLRVTGVRPDGYHLLDAEMVALDLADTLHFSDGDGLEVVDAGASAGGHGEVPTDGSNLVNKALSLVGRKAYVRLVKRIPAGAGLGGGSADAAAVLRWAGASGTAGLEMAAQLGSDVPFCFAGGPRARVRGTGRDPRASAHCRRRQCHLHVADAALRRRHVGRLPGLGRPRWAVLRQFQRPRAGGAPRGAASGQLA